MCKAIFQIHVIALVFISCGWSINWVKTILELTPIPTHLDFQNHPDESLGSETPHCKFYYPRKHRMFCVDPYQHNPSSLAGSSPLQGSPKIIIISLKHVSNKSKSVGIFHSSVVKDLNWWASEGLRANRTSPWHPPRPTL